MPGSSFRLYDPAKIKLAFKTIVLCEGQSKGSSNW